MGLLYVFPVSLEEENFAEKNNDTIVLKTYGLPYIFWAYALASITVIIFMFFAVKGPIMKLASMGDETDSLLAYSLLGFIILLPFTILSFFFYEKRIIKDHQNLQLVHKLMGLTFFSEKWSLTGEETLTVETFLSGPNVARLNATEENQGFQNKGYFVLWLNFKDGRRIQIDRHSRKIDLEKLKTLLT